MDGHIAPLADICALAKQHDALVFVDDCHATGFLGRTGRGTDEHCGVAGQVDIINSTLGKAMGGATGPAQRTVHLLISPCSRKRSWRAQCLQHDQSWIHCLHCALSLIFLFQINCVRN